VGPDVALHLPVHGGVDVHAGADGGEYDDVAAFDVVAI
jgi:hypothetical protein